MPNVVCFGEMLWDVLPTGKQAGGAPLNVAVHLHNFQVPADIVSRVGHDDLGAELLDFVRSKGLGTTYVQQGETHLTGVVKANVDNNQEVTYKIVQPVAWDYIMPTEATTRLVGAADVFVFGSLAARSATTHETLRQLLPQARLKVFDVNLRPPHYTANLVAELLQQSDLVKLNHHELGELREWLTLPADEEAALRELTERYHLQGVCVTKGADGAVLFTRNQLYSSAGVAVTVQDTIGSGDAFLAALLRGWLAGEDPADILRFACAAGALVATHQGATPAITAAQVQELQGAMK